MYYWRKRLYNFIKIIYNFAGIKIGWGSQENHNGRRNSEPHGRGWPETTGCLRLVRVLFWGKEKLIETEVDESEGWSSQFACYTFVNYWPVCQYWTYEYVWQPWGWVKSLILTWNFHRGVIGNLICSDPPRLPFPLVASEMNGFKNIPLVIQ